MTCSCVNGLLQGNVLPPILFCMYVNVVEMHLLSDSVSEINPEGVNKKE